MNKKILRRINKFHLKAQKNHFKIAILANQGCDFFTEISFNVQKQSKFMNKKIVRRINKFHLKVQKNHFKIVILAN